MSMIADKRPAASAVALDRIQAATAPASAVALASVRAATAPVIEPIIRAAYRAIAWAAYEARQGRPALGFGPSAQEVLSELAAVPPGVGPQSRVGDLPSSGSAPPLQRRAIGVSTLTAAPPPAPAPTYVRAGGRRSPASPRDGSDLDEAELNSTHNGGSAPGHQPRAPKSREHAGLT